ncbi:hypothetical protein [Streptomyces sp. SD31]|uniref:hypothetical protein n=1 Tax=Streptomyces sp. SD31 TaxID=3452208 RepID=UPI003F88BF54
MKHNVGAAPAARSGAGTGPGLLPRTALAAVPVLTLGMLAAVPSLVLAVRRGTRADWLAAVVFTAVNVAWVAQTLLTPVETHGLQYAADVLLLFVATVGATLHCLLRRSSESRPR